ncbi:MAG: tRNA lysidine(34) synthetase TilS [Planctomycetota bacterium]
MPERTQLPDALPLPAGRFAVAVSGGGDSVALLRWAVDQHGEQVVCVVHVDHAVRPESHEDSAFVNELAKRLGLPCQIARLDGGGNESTWRQQRLRVFGDVCEKRGLDGVLVGHHLDDRIETVGLRLLRGSPASGTAGLAPMHADTTVSGVRLVRPLLGVPKAALHGFLRELGQGFRRDETNDDVSNSRNRLRRLLRREPGLREALQSLMVAAEAAERLIEERASEVAATAEGLAALTAKPDDPVVRRVARRWLLDLGVPEADASPEVVDRAMSVLSPNGPRTVTLPAHIHLRRRGSSAGGGIEVRSG